MGDSQAAGQRRPLVGFMVEFVILQMCLFQVMKRQLEERRPPKRAKHSSPSLDSCNSTREAVAPPAAPLRRLMKLKTLAHLTWKMYFWSYLIELARFALFELINCEPLRDYQLLDCFLLGRFRFIGRTNKISGRMVVLFTFVFGGYRLLAYDFHTDFKFYAFEFLMYPYEEVLANDRAHKQRQKDAPLKPLDAPTAGDDHSTGRDSVFYIRNTIKELSGVRCNSILCPHKLRPPSPGKADATAAATPTPAGRQAAAAAARDDWILRPNRTAASWRTLARCSELMLLASLGGALGWAGLIGFTVGGSITTDLGFELGYPRCVDWLQRAQLPPNGSGAWCASNDAAAVDCRPPWAGLYVAPAVLAHQMDIDDIPAVMPFRQARVAGDRRPQPNALYYWTRVLVDAAESFWWYTDFMLVVSSITYIFAVSSLDILLNAREITRRLETLIDETAERRREEARRAVELKPARTASHRAPWTISWGRDEAHPHQFTELALEGGGGGNNSIAPLAARQGKLELERAKPSDTDGQPALDELSERLANLQAVLVDHFKLVRGYNEFISFALSLILGAWCAYSAVISTWMASVKSKALEFEFLVTEIGGTVIAVYFFSLAAIVRSRNHYLYGQIARLMALDLDGSGTKLRWTTIMKFYSPKPMYCFTLLGSTEISWLFSLQFVWWIVSAYIVLTNFLYMNKL